MRKRDLSGWETYVLLRLQLRKHEREAHKCCPNCVYNYRLWRWSVRANRVIQMKQESIIASNKAALKIQEQILANDKKIIAGQDEALRLLNLKCIAYALMARAK